MSQQNEINSYIAPNKPINGRIYESPAPNQAHNESASATFGGCFNSYSSSWTPARNNGQPFTPMFQSTPKQTGAPTKYPAWRNNTPSATPRRQNNELGAVRLRLIDLELSDATNSSNTSHNRSLRSTLPVWAIDEHGGVSANVTLKEVLANEALIEFATDKNGCRFLQEQYPAVSDGGIHDEIFRRMVEDRSMFLSMCRNMFGNFFVQRMVECSNTEEQEIVMEHLVTDMFALCLDKSACRVIQLAIQKLETHLASRLAAELREADLVRLSIDQNGNHVIQKIIKTLPVSAWDFVVNFFCNDDNLIAVCQDKYGCRVVQSTIEKLSEDPHTECYNQRLHLLQQLMVGITRNCGQLASNEFANYVVQHVVKCGGAMETFRDIIIEQCLLRNLLSMSQEKYASHVVEIAFLRAPHRLAFEMMEEIFEGYIPHPETNRDALDILLFHQYGNYVIQQMINICCTAILGQSERHLEQKEIEQYTKWLERIKERVTRNSHRLERFSSGKKIIEALHASATGTQLTPPNSQYH
ncbi:CRE-PUF-11 protein [Caenorhabditis remanei]|uniref:CRE-PUF-11 protein n=1 Tax=Caenorhabditis remanei TaxID=31234 RepID=E3LFV5_CAERE|nr:CRE-PUF-11 protein [Caenorhabditis remanei]